VPRKRARVFRIRLTGRLAGKCDREFEILNIAPGGRIAADTQSIIRNKFSARIYSVRNASATRHLYAICNAIQARTRYRSRHRATLVRNIGGNDRTLVTRVQNEKNHGIDVDGKLSRFSRRVWNSGAERKSRLQRELARREENRGKNGNLISRCSIFAFDHVETVDVGFYLPRVTQSARYPPGASARVCLEERRADRTRVEEKGDKRRWRTRVYNTTESG